MNALAGGARPLTLGSMCTGYGGLDMAIAAVLPVELAWVADNDSGASTLLAHHHPDVPNLGDITAVRWEDAVRVDAVTAGFPCTDLSYAGLGAGITEGTHSGLWIPIADAIGVLRPRLVVLENVRAIVTRRPGLDVVLADLARLGFDAEWTCLPASRVGASHQRWRWFLVAHAADLGHEGRGSARGRGPGPANGGVAAADPEGARWEGSRPEPEGRGPERGGRLAADAQGDGRIERRTEPARQQGRPDAAVSCFATANTDRAELTGERPQQPGRTPATGRGAVGIWGKYAPAITRWERATGRAAPHPTEPGRDGKPRLSPAFVEWLMGLPAGHVTAVPGLSRNQQLKLLGNGVVWQQGAAALAELLDRAEVVAC